MWVKESGFKSSVTSGLSLILLTEQEDSGWQAERSYAPAGAGGGPAGHPTGRALGRLPLSPAQPGRTFPRGAAGWQVRRPEHLPYAAPGRHVFGLRPLCGDH